MTSSYPLDTLPIHPPPEPWESLSSYTARLLHKNRIATITPIWKICFPAQSMNKYAHQLEATALCLEQFATLTACPQDVLWSTTGHHIRAKFGIAPTSFREDDFFHSSIGQTLRFCPRCIEEWPYYLLPWRFSAMDGCVSHRCRLVPCCTACRHPIPLLSPAIATLQCPACRFDLRSCTATILTDIQLEQTALILRDLEYLLAPVHEEGDASVVLQRVGGRLALQRQQAGLTYADIIPILHVPHWALQAMEHGPSPLGRTSFALYLQYAHYLGLNLADLFGSSEHHPPSIAPEWTPACIHVAAYHQSLLQHPPEPSAHDGDTTPDSTSDPLLTTVEHALMTLTATGPFPTLSTLSCMINVPLSTLAFNPEVRALFSRHVAARRAAQRRYWRWATHVAIQQAIQNLHEQKQPIALHLICRYTRSTPAALMYYPETATLLEELTKIPQPTCMLEQYEQSLIQRVEVARTRRAAEGAQITLTLLAREVGVVPSALQQYSAIRCMCGDLVD